jgi:4-hydroxybenzoate polyprenyltransferase
MRGAGCCINDLFDRKIDKLVERTKYRPLAQNKLKVSEALIFIFIQLLIGLIIILQFNSKIIVMGFVVIPLVIIYPLIKRFSYFPQFILGLIFNWGILIGYYSSNQTLDWRIFFLYFAGVFLTISYDTIYGFQDIDDDKKIGVKSFSILIEKKPVLFISIFYLTSFILFSSFFFSFYENLLFNVICCIFILNFFFFQVLDFIKKKELIKIFKSNIFYGGGISILIFLSNYL